MYVCIASLLMNTLMLQANWVGYWNHIPSSQLFQMVNGWEEQENDEMDFTYDGSSNTTSLVLIGQLPNT